MSALGGNEAGREWVGSPAGRSVLSRYDKTTTAMHWATILLLIGMFAGVWLLELATTLLTATDIVRIRHACWAAVGLMTLVRVVRTLTGMAIIPPLPDGLPRMQKFAGRAIDYAIYVFLPLPALIGLMHTFALGEPLRLFGFLILPPLLSINRLLAQPLQHVHQATAIIFVLLVGVQAATALYYNQIFDEHRARVLFSGGRISGRARVKPP